MEGIYTAAEQQLVPEHFALPKAGPQVDCPIPMVVAVQSPKPDWHPVLQ